jgi:transcription elongation factor Elf1
MLIDIVLPVLLLCGFFGLILLMGIVGAYIWLRWIHAQMTKCPACGRKDAGELVDSVTVDSKTSIEWTKERKGFGQILGHPQRIRVVEKTIEDRFTCQFCGNEWTVTSHEKTHTPIDTQAAR